MREAVGQPKTAGVEELSRSVIGLFCEQLHVEVSDAQYTAAEIDMLSDDKYYYGRLLSRSTRPYAEHALIRNVSRAIEYLELDGRPLRVLDVGCGLGMQALIFAALGADVVGVDLNPECVALCRKRKQYYEGMLGRTLAARFVTANFEDLPEGLLEHASFDRAYSYSAFAYILPMRRTVETISSLLTPTSKVFLWDMNVSYFMRLVGGRNDGIATPYSVRRAFRDCGFNPDLFVGASAVPHHLWRGRFSNRLARGLDNILSRNVLLSFSYTFGAARDSS